LETAEENVRRLTQIPTFELPYPDCCETKKELLITCDECPVITEYLVLLILYKILKMTLILICYVRRQCIAQLNARKKHLKNIIEFFAIILELNRRMFED
jgi:hypothetical protein